MKPRHLESSINVKAFFSTIALRVIKPPAFLSKNINYTEGLNIACK